MVEKTKQARETHQKTWIIMRDGEFYRAFPMHVLAEGYRRMIKQGSKHRWTMERGILTILR